MDDPALWTLPDGSIFPWLQNWLYDVRSTPFWWLALAAGGLGLGLAAGWLIDRWNQGTPGDWFASPGPWTLILVISGAPGAWFVWFVRDRNRDRELRTNWASITQRSVEHAWGIFRQLQEWATKEVDDSLQAAAIHQLKPFILGRPEGPIPPEAVVGNNPFAQPGLAILRALLDDRQWQERWADRFSSEDDPDVGLDSTPRSPVMLAIEGLLRDPDFPTRDFSRWNLSGLHLYEVQWRKAQIHAANLTGAWLLLAKLSGAMATEAKINGAVLEFADLTGATLLRADLTGAILPCADLTGAYLESADLTGAQLDYANLAGAKLDHADLTGARLDHANLEGARIDAKWRPLVEAAEGTRGTPVWIEEEEEEELTEDEE